MSEWIPKARRRGKAMVLVLAALLLFVPAGVYGKTGRGATVIVTLKSGDQAGGELIQVRPASLVILEPSGEDASFDLTEVSHIKIFRNSKAMQGVILGLLAGVGSGLLAGNLASHGEDPCQSLGVKLVTFYGGGLAGLIGGGVIGASAGRDLDIRLESAPPQALRASLKRISKYARIKGTA